MSWQDEMTLGNSAASRGLYEQAESYYGAALKNILKANFVDQSAQAELLYGLAELCLRQNKIEAASKYAEEALNLNELFWGPLSSQVANSLCLLAECNRKAGELDFAKDKLAKALELREYELGAMHSEVAKILGRLTIVSLESGNNTLSNHYAAKALQIHNRYHPAGGFNRFLQLEELLEEYIQQGRVEEAEQICTRSVKMLRQICGNDNPDLKSFLKTYSEFMKINKRNLAAWQLQKRAEHMSSFEEIISKAKQAAIQGDYIQADKHYSAHLTKLLTKQGPCDDEVIKLRFEYAELLKKMGRHQDGVMLELLAKNTQISQAEVDSMAAVATGIRVSSWILLRFALRLPVF